MEMTEIAGLWLGLPFLKKFQEQGEKVSSDIKALQRLEKIRAELKEQRVKK